MHISTVPSVSCISLRVYMFLEHYAPLSKSRKTLFCCLRLRIHAIVVKILVIDSLTSLKLLLIGQLHCNSSPDVQSQ